MKKTKVVSTQDAIEAYLRDRAERGLFQPPKLSEKLGFKSGMLTAILRGEKRWSMDHLDATAEFFEMEPDELVRRARALFITNEESQRPAASTPDAAGKGFHRKS